MPDAQNVTVILVRAVRTRLLVTIGPDVSCDDARRLMDEHRIRHLPVLVAGRLVGIVSDRDVRGADTRIVEPMAGALMTVHPVTVTSDTRIEHAARLMRSHRFSALPVV